MKINLGIGNIIIGEVIHMTHQGIGNIIIGEVIHITHQGIGNIIIGEVIHRPHQVKWIPSLATSGEMNCMAGHIR